jgi:hypothetical protein
MIQALTMVAANPDVMTFGDISAEWLAPSLWRRIYAN